VPVVDLLTNLPKKKWRAENALSQWSDRAAGLGGWYRKQDVMDGQRKQVSGVLDSTKCLLPAMFRLACVMPRLERALAAWTANSCVKLELRGLRSVTTCRIDLSGRVTSSGARLGPRATPAEVWRGV
jgi:hypothetical protein